MAGEAVAIEEVAVAEESEELQEDPSVMDMDDDAFMQLMATGELPQEETSEEEGSTEEGEGEGEEEGEEASEEDLDTTAIEEDLAGEDASEKDGEEEESSDQEEGADEDEVPSEETLLENTEKLNQIFSPFKANGKDMQIDNAEDAIKLMKMGANYNKKMAGLKPSLKILKVLENNNLLDEGKLNFLIDLDKKNPGAIAKLIKDSNFDTETLDNEDAPDYNPNTYTVNDTEVELDETLRDIKDTDSYATTLNIISNKWDDASKTQLLANPEGIKTINHHVSLGIFDKVSSVVERERMLGRISASTSDLDAYSMVGAAINAKGGFDKDLGISDSKLPKDKQTAQDAADPKRNKKKTAAKTTRGKTTVVPKSAYNPLSMSDDDFAKASLDKFI